MQGLAQDRAQAQAQAQAKSGVAQVGFPFRFGMVKPPGYLRGSSWSYHSCSARQIGLSGLAAFPQVWLALLSVR